MKKKTVAVLFGGQSTEHEISCLSAVTIIQNIDREQYDLLLIGITRDGRWLKTNSIEEIQSGSWVGGTTRAILSPDAGHKGVLLLEDGRVQLFPLDVVFPVLHGARGEDGTVQGLLELAEIPYVGCGVLASAVTMDKLYTKILVSTLGIRQADYELVYKNELSGQNAIESVIRRIEGRLAYPVFVKPACSGSSRGVSKASDQKQLETALLLAAEHDRKILVEETIVGHEVECAVLGAEEAKAAGVGEILAGAEFYDYEAKYESEESRTVLDPQLPNDAANRVREAAVRIYRRLDGFGMARLDFFVTEQGEVVFNEANTIPGFTSISMYPMLWEHKGLSVFQLVNKLIGMAFQR
ncbi:MAG: D-alanine--D-alanine ligase [Lachnospiraceae bacterium]|nr:D-alanine--D-alanine ligase [Lachnospiraceae bacterium]